MSMSMIEGDRIIEIKNVVDFDPDNIFDCGQCFRWERNADGSFSGIVNTGHSGLAATVRYDATKEILHISEHGVELYGDKALADGERSSESYLFWRNYFDLDRDYGKIKRHLSEGDPVMAKAIEFGGGIRILKQEPWEAVLSFIISQNNNIPRIKRCIASVAELMGKAVGSKPEDGHRGFTLPSAERLAAASVEDLAPCRLGYRAAYLVESACQVMRNGIPGSAEGLRELCGVGPKVASCIDLFGLGNVDSFPIDVWMKRVMSQLYGIPENSPAKMQEYAKEHFAPYGGIAQQYLFYYITHREL